METNLKIASFFQQDSKWQAEYQALRQIILSCELNEDYKWMHPCYTYEGNNIVLIHGFKDYFALLFFKGVLLQDKEGILVQQSENVQTGRQLRFTSYAQIESQHKVIKSYITEAIAIEKSGLKVELKKTTEYTVPEEFKVMLADLPALQTAYAKLSPGRQRAYLLYFAAAKKTETRQARIEKYLPKILAGKGLDD